MRGASAGLGGGVVGARPQRSEERAEARDERAADVRAEAPAARRAQPAGVFETRSTAGD
jgi:hypothetical protein